MTNERTNVRCERKEEKRKKKKKKSHSAIGNAICDFAFNKLFNFPPFLKYYTHRMAKNPGRKWTENKNFRKQDK